MVVVERADKLCGVSGVSGGPVWMPGTRYQEAAGVADSPGDVLAYLEGVSAGYGEEALRRRWVESRR